MREREREGERERGREREREREILLHSPALGQMASGESPSNPILLNPSC